MEQLKQNATKYSGLPLAALIHLAETPAPVNELLKREVWKELFTRYYSEGRTFNLYQILSRKPQMFANTIGWELRYEEVAIPSVHSEAFMRNLIEFIEYVDQQVLHNGLQFEWQLHELKGLQSMIERVRDAKIEDTNLRQKINLFIDKMNQTRKESLERIEQANQAETSSSTNELVITESSELMLLEEKRELMKQELKHLSIPVSKMNKKQWESSMEQFDLYYKEDQEKLIKHGLRKYDFYNNKHLALLAFKLNLTFKIPNVNMLSLLNYSSYYSEQTSDVFGSDELFYETVKDFYFSSIGATESGWVDFSNSFLERKDDKFSKKILKERVINEMKELYPYVKEFQGKNLSEILQITITEKETHSRSVKFDKTLSRWVTDESVKEEKKVSAFEKIYKLLNYIKGYGEGLHLVDYEMETFPNAKVEFPQDTELEFRQMIQDFCLFPSTLLIDELIPSTLQEEWNGSLKTSSFKENYLIQFLKHKFNSGCVSDDELSFLFKTKDGFQFFNQTTNYMHSRQGWIKGQEDFIGRFYYRLLHLFDFKKEEERKKFFQLPLQSTEFFRGHGGYLKKEYLEITIEKLQREVAHEYQLISEYFSNINESYEDYKVHEMFDYLSDFERLLLEKEGIKTGETIHHEGYKEHNTYYSSEEAKHKFVFEYFQKLYGEK